MNSQRLFYSKKIGVKGPIEAAFFYTIYIFDSDLFLYTRNLQNEHLKPVFEYKVLLTVKGSSNRSHPRFKEPFLG